MKKSKEVFFKHYKAFIIVFLIIFLFIYSYQLIYKIDKPITYDAIIENVNFIELISTVTIIIGAVVAWVELHNSAKLNEAEFIKDLNNQFIENKEMVEIEHALEMYYNKTDRGEKHVRLELDLEQDNEDRQKLINYLVYLEGLASIIDHDIVHIDQINDLFGYRFFLAVNNPVVQITELYPYSNYYQGIFRIYDKWMKFCKNKNSKDAMQVPLNDYKLKNSSYTIDGNKKFKLNPRVRKANSKDDFTQIASILYETDEYIYPVAFGKNKDDAINKMAKLISLETGLFSYNNIYVATLKVKDPKNESTYIEEIKGVLLYFDGNEQNIWKYEDVIKHIPASKQLEHVSNNYFSKYASVSHDKYQIVALAVDKRYRNQKIGFFIMCTFSNVYCDKTIELEVLKDNLIALNKYKDFLFVEKKEIDGYSIDGPKPRCLVMERKQICR